MVQLLATKAVGGLARMPGRNTTRRCGNSRAVASRMPLRVVAFKDNDDQSAGPKQQQQMATAKVTFQLPMHGAAAAQHRYWHTRRAFGQRLPCRRAPINKSQAMILMSWYRYAAC